MISSGVLKSTPGESLLPLPSVMACPCKSYRFIAVFTDISDTSGRFPSTATLRCLCWIVSLREEGRPPLHLDESHVAFLFLSSLAIEYPRPNFPSSPEIIFAENPCCAISSFRWVPFPSDFSFVFAGDCILPECLFFSDDISLW